MKSPASKTPKSTFSLQISLNFFLSQNLDFVSGNQLIDVLFQDDPSKEPSPIVAALIGALRDVHEFEKSKVPSDAELRAMVPQLKNAIQACIMAPPDYKRMMRGQWREDDKALVSREIDAKEAAEIKRARREQWDAIFTEAKLKKKIPKNVFRYLVRCEGKKCIIIFRF